MLGDEPPRDEPSIDYTGLIIVAMLTPVFVLFAFLGKADIGLSACVVLGMVTLAIKLRWNLRKHVWFWATIGFLLALHVPLVFMIQWPQRKFPTIAYTAPIGIADFLIIFGALGLAEKLFSKNSS